MVFSQAPDESAEAEKEENGGWMGGCRCGMNGMRWMDGAAAAQGGRTAKSEAVRFCSGYLTAMTF